MLQMAEKGKNWKIKELPLFPFLLFISPPPRCSIRLIQACSLILKFSKIKIQPLIMVLVISKKFFFHEIVWAIFVLWRGERRDFWPCKKILINKVLINQLKYSICSLFPHLLYTVQLMESVHLSPFQRFFAV